MIVLLRTVLLAAAFGAASHAEGHAPAPAETPATGPSEHGGHAENSNCTAESGIAGDLNCLAEEEHGGLTHAVATYIILPFSAIIMTAVVIGAWCNHRAWICCRWIPESFILICFGAVMGGFYRWASEHSTYIKPLTLESFAEGDALILNLVLLPVIIFEGGWSLHKKNFGSQLGPIMIFAIFGTLISWAIVAMGMLWTGHMGWHSVTDLRTCLVYSSLISAVDPVASLSTYSALQVEPLLFTVVFGESTVNDAVAIALFSVLNDDTVWFSRGFFGTAATIFFQVLLKLFGSALVGVLIAMILVLVCRCFHMRHMPEAEITFLFVSCFLTFAIAEGPLGLSGIIAVLACSMFLSIYAVPHLSAEGTVCSSFFIKQIASICDMAVFLLVGFAVVFINLSEVKLGLWIMLWCLLGRAVPVFSLGLIVDAVKVFRGKYHDHPKENWDLLSFGHLFAMFWAGLRGGIALVLVLEIGHWADEKVRVALAEATLILICVFLLFFGGSTECVLRAFGIPMGEAIDEDKLWNNEVMESRRGALDFCHTKILEPCLVGEEVKEEHEHEHRVETHEDPLEFLHDKLQKDELLKDVADGAEAADDDDADFEEMSEDEPRCVIN